MVGGFGGQGEDSGEEEEDGVKLTLRSKDGIYSLNPA